MEQAPPPPQGPRYLAVDGSRLGNSPWLTQIFTRWSAPILIAVSSIAYAATENRSEALYRLGKDLGAGALMAYSSRKFTQSMLTTYFRSKDDSKVIDTQPTHFSPEMLKEKQNAIDYLDRGIVSFIPLHFVSILMLPATCAFAPASEEFAQIKKSLENVASGKWAIINRPPELETSSSPQLMHTPQSP